MNYDYENEINEDEYIDMTNLSVGDTLDTTPISQNDTAYLEVDVMVGDTFQITGLYKLAVVDENNEVLEIQEQSGSERHRRCRSAGYDPGRKDSGPERQA